MKSTRSVLLARRATATFYGIVGESWGPWVSSSDGCKMFRPQAQSRLSRAAACGTTLARRTGVGTRGRSEGLGLRPRAWAGPRAARRRGPRTVSRVRSHEHISKEIYTRLLFACRPSPPKNRIHHAHASDATAPSPTVRHATTAGRRARSTLTLARFDFIDE